MASHMGKRAKPTSKSPHGIIVAIVGCALVVCGIAMFVLLFTRDPVYRGRPQETVRAKLSHVDHEADRHYDTGYKWWGTYEWSYQGSSGYYEARKGYERDYEVPKHRSVRIYLGQDDAWHTVESREESDLVFGGVALVIIGVVGIVFGILMRRMGISF